MRESRTAEALAWLFGIVCVVFVLCSVQMWGDSIINLYPKSQDSHTPRSAQSQSLTKSPSQSHLELFSMQSTASGHLNADNFITLDSMPELGMDKSKLLELKPPKTFAPNQTPKIPESTQTAPKPNAQPTPADSETTSKPHTPTSDSKISESSPGKAPTSITPKPKVLLIMDDLSTAAQLKSLEKLSLNITPSIFPATKQNAKTPHLAASLAQNNKTYMLHLPLEAINFEQKELMPLKTGMSKEALRQALQKIRHDFPALVYINNHTGSKFTQSKADMENLLEAMEVYGFKFIDSVTTPNIASEAISRDKGQLIMQRDLFLDNEQKVAYTKERLQALIKKAQKSGYAIAICHPHPSTFKALSLMEGELIQNLELVSPQELEAYLNAQNITQYKRHKYYATQGN